MNTKQHGDKTLVLFCNLQVGKLIEPKNSKNFTENAQVLIVSPIDVLSPLSTTQCPNRSQYRHKHCTISCCDTDSTRACHVTQDAGSFFLNEATVCTTVPPLVHNDVHLVPRKACHSGKTARASSLGISARHKYHRNPTSKRKHVINEVLMIYRKWLFMFSSTSSSSSCLALSKTKSLPEKEDSTKNEKASSFSRFTRVTVCPCLKIITPLFKRFSRGCPDSHKFPHATRYQPPGHCFSESAPINHIFKFLIETFIINLSKGRPPGCSIFYGSSKTSCAV